MLVGLDPVSLSYFYVSYHLTFLFCTRGLNQLEVHHIAQRGSQSLKIGIRVWTVKFAYTKATLASLKPLVIVLLQLSFRSFFLFA